MPWRFRSIALLGTSTVVLMCHSFLAAQTPDPLSFFPHHLGDVWKYVLNPQRIERNVVLSDSVYPDGHYYIRTSRFGRFIIDTVSREVYSVFEIGQELYYKLSAARGDYWIVSQSGSGRQSARVADIYQTNLFGGFSTTVKVIRNYSVNASGTDSLLTNTDYLASGIGLIYQTFDGFPVLELRGARINGHVYGTISSVSSLAAGRSPLELKLYQNYPNPFNPQTTIAFYLPKAEEVVLRVFDVLGCEVIVLCKGFLREGAHQISFSGQTIHSGTYFYSLMTKQGSLTKRMTYLR